MNVIQKDEPCFSYEIDVERLPDSGLTEQITASEVERIAVSEQLGLVSISGLVADIAAHAWRKQGIKVSGTITAVVEQTCVVTLDTFESQLATPFERYYLRGNAPGHTGSVITIDPLEEDESEVLETNKIDLAPVIVETLSLALDPYPKKPGAEFDWQDTLGTRGDAPQSPFAVLKGLKTDN